MQLDDTADLRLAGLHPPRRNRYATGALLGADDFETEQDYHRGARMRPARLGLGAGVVCGLDVAAGDGDGRLSISPGLAMDAWGREIVVPDRFDIRRVRERAPCSAPMAVRIRYRERAREPVPTPAPGEPAGSSAAEPRTWVEGFAVSLEPQAAGASPVGCGAEVLDLVRRGALSEALDALGRDACADPPADPSIVLAGVCMNADGSIVVDRRPRQVAATSSSLLQLIACLVALLDEGRADHPAPKRSRRPTA